MAQQGRPNRSSQKSSAAPLVTFGACCRHASHVLRPYRSDGGRSGNEDLMFLK